MKYEEKYKEMLEKAKNVLQECDSPNCGAYEKSIAITIIYNLFPELEDERIKEEKARAYDEALERAKYALNTDMDNSGHWAVNYIFPELKESEDDKIKKDDDSQNEFELIQD